MTGRFGGLSQGVADLLGGPDGGLGQPGDLAGLLPGVGRGQRPERRVGGGGLRGGLRGHRGEHLGFPLRRVGQPGGEPGGLVGAFGRGEAASVTCWPNASEEKPSVFAADAWDSRSPSAL